MLTNTAIQYLRTIQDSPLITQIPRIFLDQVQAGSEDMYITGQMLSDRLFSITVSDAKPIGNANDRVAVKLTVVAIFNPQTGEVIPQTDKDAKTLPTGFMYLPGFNTLGNVEFGPNEVANGTLTPLQLQQLVEYGQKWQAGLNSSSNPGHWYEPGNTKMRVYFSNNDASSEFRFVPEARINPNNGAPTIGIGQPLLYNLRLLGSGITAGTTQLRTKSPVAPTTSTYAPQVTAPAPDSFAAKYRF